MLSSSKALNGVPVRAVYIPTRDQPPSARTAALFLPLLNHGVSQIGAITKRFRMSKSELPQSSFGLKKSVYPRLPNPAGLESPCKLSSNVELMSSSECAHV